jgi:U32 family peptidase
MTPDQINGTDRQTTAADKPAMSQPGSKPVQQKQINRPSMDHRPELLAPAGDFESLRAAIRNGADAVYLGAGSFNARQKAANFGGGLLQEAIDEAHRHALRVYLTLNTLVTDDELPSAARVAEEAYVAGIDGIILQDVGLIRTIRQKLPDLPLFASTQMTIGDAAGLRAAARLGLKRIILARELSVKEIKHLCDLAAELGLEIEVFVHGALCISISGQCLMSSLNGGRSGNRGACAQPCRLPWRLGKVTGPVNQENAPTGPSAAEPLLSPRDQGLFAHLDELRQAGVTSLKIEGRMRNSTYVGQVVSVYRELLDQLDQTGQTGHQLSLTAARRRLLLAFNRGGSFNDRYLTGHMEREFLSGKSSGSHGVLLGTISRLNARSGEMTIQLDANWPVDTLPGRGDVLSIRRPQAAEETASAPIGAIRAENGQLVVRSFHPDVLDKFMEGDPVYRMTDHAAELQSEKADRGRTAITLQIKPIDPATVRLTATVLNGPQAGLQHHLERPLESINAIAPERLDQQLRKTGQTVFRVVTTDLSNEIALSIGSLNDLRRQLLEQLTDKIVTSCRRTLPTRLVSSVDASNLTRPIASSDAAIRDSSISSSTAASHMSSTSLPYTSNSPHSRLSPILSAYYYRLPTDLATIACGADEYVLPLIGLTATLAPELVQILRQTEPNCRILAWLPPFNSGRLIDTLPELIQDLPSWGFDGILAIQAGPDIAQLPDTFTWQIDSGANITNSVSLRHWLELGADAAALSHELNGEQAQALLHSLMEKQTATTARSQVVDAPDLPDASDQSAMTSPGPNPDPNLGSNPGSNRGPNPGPIANPSPSQHLPASPEHQIQTIVRPLYGHLRVMTNVYCPVGHNLPGCRRCHTCTPDEFHPDPGSLYQLEDRRQLTFPLLTHPRDCHIEIMQHSILCVPQPLLDLQQSIAASIDPSIDPSNDSSSNATSALSASPFNNLAQHAATRLAARLFFLHETEQDRQQLIRQARDLLTTAGEDQSSQIQAIVAFTDTAAEIARRTGSKLHQDLPISLMPAGLN